VGKSWIMSTEKYPCMRCLNARGSKMRRVLKYILGNSRTFLCRTVSKELWRWRTSRILPPSRCRCSSYSETGPSSLPTSNNDVRSPFQRSYSLNCSDYRVSDKKICTNYQSSNHNNKSLIMSQPTHCKCSRSKGQRSRSHGKVSTDRQNRPIRTIEEIRVAEKKRRCHNFDRKLYNSSFCACAVQIWPMH